LLSENESWQALARRKTFAAPRDRDEGDVSSVRLVGISNSYDDVPILKGIDLTIDEGNFVTILGASGSGKTTCLRIIAGFVIPNAGRVFIGRDDVTTVPPHRRDTGLVFQHYALFPHLTVSENVGYGLTVRRLPRPEIQKRTQDALRLVHLEDVAQRHPKQLSGGQKQRVALARAVAIKPKVLLLDEPLGALDLKLREELQTEIRRVQQTLGITTLSVTHDQGEALSMSDRVVVMRDGRILQVETPTALYQKPNSVYVARFVGQMNILSATVVACDELAQQYTIAHDDPAGERIEVLGRQVVSFSVGEKCFVAFRPEDSCFGEAHSNRVNGVIEKATYQGSSWKVECRAFGGHPLSVALSAASQVPARHEKITICWSPNRCLLLKSDRD
jgi:spermidine/putrescine ABC transporter ATP-binding subunit